MTDTKTKKLAHWTDRISAEGAELAKLRAHNQQSWHSDAIHEDRFRYHHEVEVDGVTRQFTCGTKYDPNDTRSCPFCAAGRCGKSAKDAVTLWDEGYYNSTLRDATIREWETSLKKTKS